jgi:hypothetical protein
MENAYKWFFPFFHYFFWFIAECNSDNRDDSWTTEPERLKNSKALFVNRKSGIWIADSVTGWYYRKETAETITTFRFPSMNNIVIFHVKY